LTNQTPNEQPLIGRDATGSEHSLQSLKESERLYRTLTEAIPCAIYRCACDDDWTMHFLSDAILEVSGYPASDFIGNSVRTYASIIHPDDRKHVRECVLDGVARKESYAVEYRITHADGSVRWVYEKGQGVFGATGETAWLDGVIVDITERRRSQDALRESEERYRLLAENATDILWQMDMSGRFTFVSPAVGLFGYEVEDWVGHHMLEFLPPHERPTFLERFARDPQDPRLRRYEVQMLKKDGSLVWMDVSADFAMDNDRPTCVQGVARDITERKLAEQALRESEELYRGIVENSFDMIMLTDSDGTITYLSPSATTVIGHQPEELIGTKRSIVHPDDVDNVMAQLEDALNGGRGSGLEYRVITKAGETKWVSHSWVSVMDGNRTKTVVSVVRDITAHRQMEEARKKAIEDLERAYDLQRQFLSSVTHEVRTPLTAVRGYAEMLLEGMAGPLNSRQEDLLRRVLAGSHHLLDLVDEVLEMARLRSGAVALRPKVCKPCRLVERLVLTIAQQAEKKGVEISFTRNDDLPMGLYDEQKLAIIVTNILSNAVKFTENGRIDVAVSRWEQGAEVIIADTGPGIRRRDLPTIFDEFVQYDYPGKHKPAGFGLGLAIVASMVDVIGATLTVSSRRGVGTAFTLNVPTIEYGAELAKGDIG
jgi:PAS domain S-box-containing protein